MFHLWELDKWTWAQSTNPEGDYRGHKGSTLGWNKLKEACLIPTQQ
jgi:hypothetical protein